MCTRYNYTVSRIISPVKSVYNVLHQLAYVHDLKRQSIVAFLDSICHLKLLSDIV